MNLFNKLIQTNKPDSEEVKKFKDQIKQFGSTLSFEITTEEDGWSAQCNEIPAIITGGIEVNLTKKLIEDRIETAIACAFDLPAFSEIAEEVKPIVATGYKSSFSFVTA